MKIEKDVEEQYSREDRRYYIDTAPLIDFLWQKIIRKNVMAGNSHHSHHPHQPHQKR